MANEIVQNHLILFTNFNVLHTFQKVKIYVFHGYFAFSSIQTVHVFIIVLFVSASQYTHEICVMT